MVGSLAIQGNLGMDKVRVVVVRRWNGVMLWITCKACMDNKWVMIAQVGKYLGMYGVS